MILEYITLGVYFVLLLLLGGIFAKLNTNLSDFVRGGGKGTWWILGSSMLMSGISAFTFTANGSAAFEAGWSFLVIYAANVAGYFCGWLFLGRWYRQTRAFTGADVVRGRFGTPAEQFSAAMGVLLGPVAAAVQLWALAVFVSSVFGFPLMWTVLVVGLVVVAYSVSGGSWAVMATDFVQGIVLMGITVILAVLAYGQIGGFSGFAAAATAPEMAETFRFFKSPGEFPGDRFTWQWCVIIFIMQFLVQIHLNTAGRYLAAKDGREASRAALLAMILMAVGTFVWFFPPMVARLLYAEEVLATQIQEPTTAAYAVIAAKLLPTGMLGVMIAAMFSATMSSIDSGLTGQTSVIMRNIVPRIRGFFGLPELGDATNLRWCRVVSSMLGCLIILFALLMVTLGKVALFDAFLLVGSIVTMPMSMPLIAGLLLRRLSPWAYFVIMISGMIPSVYSLLGQAAGGEAWTIQERSMWVMVFGGVATAICWLLRGRASKEFQAKEKEFFRKMTTPVDFAKEIGRGNDAQQARLLGRIVAGMGGLMSLFLFVPNSWSGRFIILCLVLFILGIGCLLLWSARRSSRLEGQSENSGLSGG